MLFYIKEIRNYFIDNQHKFTNDQPICKAFSEVMNGLKNCKEQSFDSKQFIKSTEIENKLFYGCKKDDTKNILSNLIESLLSELNEENESNESDLQIDFSNKLQAFNDALREIKNNNNIINAIFIGFYETIYYCRMKKVNIYSFQNYSFILFDLEKIAKNYNKNKLNLELCFKYYYREKRDNDFYCSKCNEIHKDNEYEKIYRPPKALLLISPFKKS